MKPDERSLMYYEPLRRLAHYVEANYTEEIPLSAAAKFACMEPRYFCSYFHRKVGICFTFWLNNIRIAKAAEALGRKDNTILEVALDAGFASLRTFERTFRNQIGMTPMQFKKLVRPG